MLRIPKGGEGVSRNATHGLKRGGGRGFRSIFDYFF